MEWNDYHLILAVVREKSIRGAARVLGVSHATVSRRLAHLNNQPGGPLVQKSPTGLWPTKAGEVVVTAAEKIEALAVESSRRSRALAQDLSGPLLISAPVLILKHLLMDDVAQFAELYPKLDLTIDASDTLADLDRAEADIVIRTSKDAPAHWVGRRLFPYTLSIYAHKEYLATTEPEDRRWIAPPSNDTRWSDWLAQSPYPEAPIGLTITNIQARLEAIKRGFGMGRAACFMADQDPDLVRLAGAPVVDAEPFWLLCHPDFARTARAKATLRFFAAAIEAQRPLIRGDAVRG
ncbi:MAG: LysR family transcriptional regulator [Pseudomonadota bacterium]